MGWVYLSNTTLPERIISQGTWYYPRYHNYYDTVDIHHPLPTTFFDPTVAKILKDSFLIENPNTVLKVQALALENANQDYRYSWHVGVGYGMMPGNPYGWGDISLGRYIPEAKKYVMDRLIRNRSAQTKLYDWARPTILSAWSAKSDSTQADDMFAIWKCTQYLKSYNYTSEVKREKLNAQTDTTYYQNPDPSKEPAMRIRVSSDFTGTDWLGRSDYDAKLYAFWHRRIKEYTAKGSGFSLEDARFWTDKAMADMNQYAKPTAAAMFKSWKEEWLKK